MSELQPVMIRHDGKQDAPQDDGQGMLQKQVQSLVMSGRHQEAFAAAEGLDVSKIPNRFTGRRNHAKDFTGLERTILLEAMPITIATPEAMVQLIRATMHVVGHKVPGAFVECGVFAGGSVLVMLRTLLYGGVLDREFWLYDTFAGFPKPEAADYEYGVGPALVTWHKFKDADDKSEEGSNWLNAPLEHVQQQLAMTGYSTHRLHYVKGLVENTIPAEAPDQIALLHLDTDFYRSTRHELVHLYPRLSPGGIILFDDYGALHGSRTAIDEYLAEQKIPMLLARIDEHVRLGVKI